MGAVDRAGRWIASRRRAATRELRTRRHRRTDPYVFVHINKTGGTSIVRTLGIPQRHRTARELIAEMGRPQWDEKTSFTVVRNPWDKVVSLYSFRRRTNETGLRDAPIPFDEWVRRVHGPEVDPAYNNSRRMFAPQVEWLRDDREQFVVDHVLRFESLDADFDRLARMLGVDASLPHLNRSDRGRYTSYYDDETAEMVADWFAEDIERFGYTFGG